MTDPIPGATSAGALLRAARERQGLHIAALAASIKVTPRKLDALENDRWHELPDATFTRALAQTVCRTLKIDARPVLALLPASSTVTLERVSNASNQPFRERPGREEPALGSAAIRPMVWAAAVLMLAALAVYFLPSGWWTGGDSSQPAAVPMEPVPLEGAAPVPQPGAAAPEVVAPQTTAAEEAIGATATATAPAAASAASVPSAEPVMPALAAREASAETVTLPAAARDALLQVSATEPSWVDVRDAQGRVLLSRTVLPGEALGLNGPLPLRLVVGNASGTRLAFRGQPVELAPRTRDNVARLELQ